MAQDILTVNGEIQVKDGDFVIGNSDHQHVRHILLAHPGHYKNAAPIGVGVHTYLNSPLDGKIRQELERKIKEQLGFDSAKQVSVAVKGNTLEDIEISAVYG